MFMSTDVEFYSRAVEDVSLDIMWGCTPLIYSIVPARIRPAVVSPKTLIEPLYNRAIVDIV